MKISPRTSIDVGHVVAREPLRDLLDRLDVGGDVLAFRAVAARRRLDEPAVLVAQRNRQPVDLRLGRECDGASSARPRKRRMRATKSLTSSFAEGIAERQHRTRGGAPCRNHRPARHRPSATDCPPGSARESAPRSLHCASARHRSRRPRFPEHRSGNRARRDGRSRRQATRVRRAPRLRSMLRWPCRPPAS